MVTRVQAKTLARKISRRRNFFLNLLLPQFAGYSVGGQDFTGYTLEIGWEQEKCVYRLVDALWAG
jgi:hypothetical protein